MPTGNSRTKKKQKTPIREGAEFGIFFGVMPGLIVSLTVAFSLEVWWFPFATLAATTALGTLIGGIVMLVSGKAKTIAALKVVGWIIGFGFGLFLVGFGITMIVTYTPECVPSETVSCHAIRNGQYLGEVTNDGAFRNFLIALIPMIPGFILLASLIRVAYRRLDAYAAE